MKTKHYRYILTIIFILSLIPMYIIGIYNHPSVDDYYYGTETARIWNATGSFIEVAKTSFTEMKNTYNNWQGNFAAIFLMRLQPGIFGEASYIWSSIILITTFVITMVTFFYTFLRKWFEAGKTASYITALVVTFCAIQFTYVPSDSFYWFNGSIYYTFFFSLMLVLFTCVTIAIKSQKTAPRIIAVFFALPLAFLIGGGNYATALFTVLILFTLTVLMICKKNKSFIPLVFITLVSGASLVFSMIAPGNAIRQESVGGNSGVIKALVYSFAYGGYNIANSTTAPVLIMWIMLLPLFYRIAKRSSLSFRHPLFVLLFTFGLYCAQGTPVFYAQGLRMPYRMMNIIYFSYYIFMTFNLIYLMGYIGQKFGDSLVLCKFARMFDLKKDRFIYIMTCMIIFMISCVGICKVNEAEDGSAHFSGMPLSVSATYSLINGDAAQYDRECNERVEYITSTPDMEVVVPPLSVKPEPIFHTDITTDPFNWRNVHMSNYFGKATIRVEE